MFNNEADDAKEKSSFSQHRVSKMNQYINWKNEILKTL